MVGAQILASLQKQGVVAGHCQIGDLNAGRISPSACGADGNYGNTAYFALGDQVAFLTDSIDGIYDNVRR